MLTDLSLSLCGYFSGEALMIVHIKRESTGNRASSDLHTHAGSVCGLASLMIRSASLAISWPMTRHSSQVRASFHLA